MAKLSIASHGIYGVSLPRWSRAVDAVRMHIRQVACVALYTLLATSVVSEALTFSVFTRATIRANDCDSTFLDQTDGASGLIGSQSSVHGNGTAGCNGSGPWDAFDIATSDLLHGDLSVVSFTTASDATLVVPLSLAQAYFEDTITLHGDGAGTGRIGMRATGTVESTGVGTFQFAACVGISSGDVDPATTAHCQTLDNYNQGNTSVGVPTQQTDIDFLVLEPFSAPSEPINIFTSLFALTSNGFGTGSAAIDFGHTGQLFIDLPTGYSFTSQSEVLLTGGQPAASVPEPSTALLMLVGITGLLMFRRRSLTTLR